MMQSLNCEDGRLIAESQAESEYLNYQKLNRLFFMLAFSSTDLCMFLISTLKLLSVHSPKFYCLLVIH